MTKWAIEHARFTYTAIVLLIIAGVLSYMNMPRQEDPGFVIRTARVTTLWPGASPERVENLVTDPLEEIIQEIPEIDYIKSESWTGLSMIDVNIQERYKNMRPIWDSLRRKVDRVRERLPEGVVGPYVDDEFGDVYGTLVAITGKGYTYAELKDIADLARDDLLRLPDVAKVNIHGVQEERVFVDYNEARLSELGLSSRQLQEILAKRNIILPGGNVSNTSERIVVEPTGNFESLDDLRFTVINLPDSNQTIYLKDIADIHSGYVEPATNRLRYKGEEGLMLAVSMREGGNIITLGEEINQLLDGIRATYPIGLEFQIASFQTDVVDKIIGDFSINLLEAVVIVILVMILSLGLRIGLLVASIIPTVILISFLVMNSMGITLDQISLAALVIALGLLVDSSIVVNENTVNDIAAGLPPKTAAIKASKELRRPLLISACTTSAAFLPIYLAKSAAGEYTQSIFLVVFIALIAAWILAMTLSPLLATQFLGKKKAQKENPLHRLVPHYSRFLEFTLRHKWWAVAAGVLLVLLAFVGFQFVPNTFFPDNDRPVVTLAIELPSNTPIERTDEVVASFEQFLSAKEDVVDWSSFIGSAAPRYVLTYSPESPRPEYAYMLINTTSDEAASQLLDELRSFGEERFLDAQLTLRRIEYGPIVKYPIEVRISGKNMEELQRIAGEAKQELAQIPGTVNISDDWGRRAKKLVVRVDQAAALRAGVTSADVANSLQTYLSGYQTTEFRREEDLIPIMLRSEAPNRENIENLQGISVFSQAGNQVVVPLRQVATIETQWQPNKIFRRDTLRTLTVRSDLQEGYVAQDVLGPFTAYLDQASQTWPPGFFYAVGGEEEASAKASKSINDQLPVAILVIILLLMLQFNSLRRTFIILCTIPLGLFGVSFGLLVTQLPLGFVTFLGVVALSGIVIANGVVLIDRIRLEEEEGLSPYDAVIAAARRRMVPILLTTATTIGGMIPLVIGGGPMFSPMATAIVFGLLFATGLALLIVPTLYCLLFKIENRGI